MRENTRGYMRKTVNLHVELGSDACAIHLAITTTSTSKAILSKSLGKLHPKIDSLQDPNGLGVYQCKMRGGYFFTIQEPMLAPPEMLTTYANNSEWIKLCKINEKLLASYGGKVNREKTNYRHAKKNSF
jgi:hypothetical protein